MKRQSAHLLGYVFLVNTLLFASLAYSETPARATITVPFELLPPMKTEENGVLGGVHKVLLDAVAEKLKVDIKYVVVPFARSLLGLKSGIYDLTNGKFRTPEREEFLHFVEPPFETKIQMVFFVRKGMSKKIRNYESLSGLKIATMNGRTYAPQFDADTKLNKFVVTGVDQQLHMLLADRVDAAIMTDIEGIYAVDKMGIRDKVELAEFSISNNIKAYFAVSKKSKLMGRIGEVESIVGEMAASGETDRIYHNYFTSRGLSVPAYK